MRRRSVTIPISNVKCGYRTQAVLKKRTLDDVDMDFSARPKDRFTPNRSIDVLWRGFFHVPTPRHHNLESSMNAVKNLPYLV